jgi:predicted nucleic acid-binding protein
MEIASKAAQLIRDYKRKRITLDLPDAVIAAICILHNLILLTYSTKHYPISEIKFYPLPSIES